MQIINPWPFTLCFETSTSKPPSYRSIIIIIDITIIVSIIIIIIMIIIAITIITTIFASSPSPTAS